MKTNYTTKYTGTIKHRLMNTFLYKAVFNQGKENWCALHLREYMEYRRRELGRSGFRQWRLSWITLKSLRAALSMSWEINKSEWQRPSRFAFLKKASSLDLSDSERSHAIAGSAYPTFSKSTACFILCSWILTYDLDLQIQFFPIH